VGAGGGEGAMDAANILKPALARGELRAIGTTTTNIKYFEKKSTRKTFPKNNEEPDTESAISILRGIKKIRNTSSPNQGRYNYSGCRIITTVYNQSFSSRQSY
jgi:ATP-dependent Clp protease ATP-binding subunit ClpA